MLNYAQTRKKKKKKLRAKAEADPPIPDPASQEDQGDLANVHSTLRAIVRVEWEATFGDDYPLDEAKIPNLSRLLHFLDKYPPTSPASLTSSPGRPSIEALARLFEHPLAAQGSVTAPVLVQSRPAAGSPPLSPAPSVHTPHAGSGRFSWRRGGRASEGVVGGAARPAPGPPSPGPPPRRRRPRRRRLPLTPSIPRPSPSALPS